MTEFHHVNPKKKHKRYDNLIRRKICTEQLVELDKCVLLCALCHKLIHAQNINVSIQLTLNIDGKSFSQTMVGQMIIDMKEKAGRIFCADRIKLYPYLVKIADDDPVRMIGVELDQIPFVKDLLGNLKNYKKVLIWDEIKNEVVFKLEYEEPNDFRLRQSINFPFLGLQSADDKTKLWLHNGVFLDEEGNVQNHGTIEITGSMEGLHLFPTESRQ